MNMKSTEFIKWDNLKNIPYSLCSVVVDDQAQSVDVYFGSEMVFTDYNHVGHYFLFAVQLFETIKNKNANWVNLENLWRLRNCIREHKNHCLGLEALIWGELPGDLDYIEPLTKKRFDAIIKAIQEADPYATI